LHIFTNLFSDWKGAAMRRLTVILIGLTLCVLPAVTAIAEDSPLSAPKSVLIDTMASELDYSMKHLANEEGQKPYFLSYTITDTASVTLRAGFGAILGNDTNRRRLLDVDLRVGEYGLDSTRQIRGGRGGRGFGRFFGGAATVALDDSEDAVKHALWRATNSAFKSALERHQQVLTNVKTMVEEESRVADFSREEPSAATEEDSVISLDREGWAERIRRVSRLAADHLLIYGSTISLSATAENRHMVSSEGTRLKTGRKLLRVSLSASTRAADGMDLSQGFIFDAATEADLPSEKELTAAFLKVIKQVLALREAPLVEPYVGPAILLNRASGVFFHEIFGHRIEGHRQKDVEEGQTFTKMIGQPVLPEFLSVCDDPTQARHGAQSLRGFYRFDDEGVPASRVDLVVDGILKTFLLSRSPVEGFSNSNGHGRREPGRSVVSRQGNLMILSDRAVTIADLRKRLVEECKKQDKPFGFLFKDITGGFTTTQRSGPQAFKVLPVVVYKVFADGSPDQLVRGVDIVGTPLSCFSKILCTGDDPAVFNGSCGAESGWVPVSAVSPSILVEQIEIEKRQRSQERLPLLPPPVAKEKGEEEDPILTALAGELERSVTLQLEDLDKPYFIQYAVDDTSTHRIGATCGAITGSSGNRSRLLYTKVRVGSYELDNTNFGGSTGGFGRRGGGRGRGGARRGGAVPLPIDGDVAAIRRAIWTATDGEYKSAAEALAQKRAYLEDRKSADRPADFTRQEPARAIAPLAAFSDLDHSECEDLMRRITARFVEYDFIQNSSADLTSSVRNSYLLNSEGTRLRQGKTRISLRITAEVQADDGDRISDSLSYIADSPAGFPTFDEIIDDVEGLATSLELLTKAPVLEDYTGPVLFDEEASPQLLGELLARGIAASASAVGGGRRRFSATTSLEKYLDKRILPRSFQVYDDPRAADCDGVFLAGSYLIDEEGVAAERVDLVTGGSLKKLLTCRSPSKYFTKSNGHGRRSGRSADASAGVGCLFLECAEGLAKEELRARLLETADDQGLDYALRVTRLRGSAAGGGMPSLADMRSFMMGRQRSGGGGGGISDPVYVYKVYVEDGREELVRQCEFGDVSVSDLRKIVAAGKTPTVSNRGGQGAGSSIIAPAVILEEVELFAIEEEREKKPFIVAPHARPE
jgi:predicted Zn-dependent protease